MILKEHLGDDFAKYNQNITLANIMAIVAENYALEAENILRKKNVFTLQNKQDYKTLRRQLATLMKRVDNLEEDKRSDALFSASDFAKEVMDTLALKELTKEDNIKIISHIQNNY